MTDDEHVTLLTLRELDRREPASVDALVGPVGDAVEQAGLGPATKVDNVLVGRVLMACQRADPPQVADDFDPADVDQHGRVREGARRLWTLTPDGEAELERLERLAEGD